MRKPELSGRMSKWSVHLSGYDIMYDPRTAIKSQSLTDFVSDFSPAIQNLADKEILALKGDNDAEVWQIHIDAQAVRCEFKATNKETEYEALILGLRLALDMGIRNLQVYSESLLIVNHVNDEYVARDSKMIAYLKVAKELKQKFKDFKLKQVPRDQNVEADALATLGATFKPTELANIPIAHMLDPSIQKAEEIDKGELKDQQDVENGAAIMLNADDQSIDPDWRTPYLDWLKDGKLPADKKRGKGIQNESL
ncbi:uncharacterized protein LOC141640186 [Silene latifolia]|uniref:uncharacterized protein LOC141640186 n=1 Tax=Silene latifolia TaxID=37657 RepID=UPI003D76DDCD